VTVEIAARDLMAMGREGSQYALVDVREESAFVAMHLIKASSMPLRQLEMEVPLRIPRRECPVVLCDGDGGGEAIEAAGRMVSWGYTDVRVLAKGLEGWRAAGLPLYSGIHTLSKAFGEAVEAHLHTPSLKPEEVARRRDAGEPFLLIDCRPHEEYLRGSLPGSINIPGVELPYRIANVAADASVPIVVHCAGRTRSIIGAQSLRDSGVANPVYALENGTMGWLLAGFKGAQPDLPAAGFDGPPRNLAETGVHAEGIRAAHGVGLATFENVQAWCGGGSARTTCIVDVRTAQEYRAGHHAQAVHAPGGQLLQATDKYLVVQNARVVVADDNGIRASIAAGWLRRMGWEDVVVWPMFAGAVELVSGPESRRFCANPHAEIRTVSATRLAELVERAEIDVFDLDTSLEYEKAHIPGARFIKRRSLRRLLGESDAARQIALTSSDGLVARFAAQECGSTGRVMVLEQGKSGWAAHGLAMASGPESMIDPPDDVWRRPVEARGDPVSNMKQYLSWEIGLMEQIGKDKSIRFAL
jgi:rhodanese-related sulfurtransferase